MKQCSKCGKDFTPDAGFEYQKMCGQCFAKVKENSRSPPRSLPNSGVGIALLDPSGTKLAPALVASKVDLNRQPRLTDFFEERAKLLEKAWFRVSFIDSQAARERIKRTEDALSGAVKELFLSEVRRERE